MDDSIEMFCADLENCRRIKILRSIGSDEAVLENGQMCCDICNPIPDSLSLHPKLLSLTRQKRRYTQRQVDEDLEKAIRQKLLQERDNYIQKHSHYLMIGIDFVCPNIVINDICKNSRFITSEENLTTTYDLRPEIKKLFYAAIKHILLNAPTQKRIRTGKKDKHLQDISNYYE